MTGSATALCVVAIMGAAGATSASAATYRGAQDAVVAYSDAGDWVGKGRQRVWRGADSVVTLDGDDDELGVSVNGGPSSAAYSIALAAADGAPLDRGVYTAAQRAPFRAPGHPGIDIGGEGAGCNRSDGAFEIRDIARSNGRVTRLWAVYEQHCEGVGAAMWGEIRIGMPPSSTPATTFPSVVRWPAVDVGAAHTTVPVTVAAGSSGLNVGRVALGGEQAGDFAVREDGCTGRTVPAGGTCQVWVRFLPREAGLRQAGLAVVDRAGGRYDVPLQAWSFGGTTAFRVAGDAGDGPTLGNAYAFTPANARLTMQGTRTGLVAEVVGADDQYWSLAVSPPDGDILAPGSTYTDVHEHDSRGLGAGLSLDNDFRSCRQVEGSFGVETIDWRADGRLRTGAVDFEQRCDGATAAARGTFRWRAGDTTPPAPWMSDAAAPTTLPTAPAIPPAAETPGPPTAAGSGTATGSGATPGGSPAPGPAPGAPAPGDVPSAPQTGASRSGAAAPRAGGLPQLTFRGAQGGGRRLSFAARFAGPGTLAVVSTVKVRGRDGRARTIVLGRGRVTADAAGTRTLVVRLAPKALRALGRRRSVPMTTRTTWRPHGGRPVTARAKDVLRVG